MTVTTGCDISVDVYHYRPQLKYMNKSNQWDQLRSTQWESNEMYSTKLTKKGAMWYLLFVSPPPPHTHTHVRIPLPTTVSPHLLC